MAKSNEPEAVTLKKTGISRFFCRSNIPFPGVARIFRHTLWWCGYIGDIGHNRQDPRRRCGELVRRLVRNGSTQRGPSRSLPRSGESWYGMASGA